MSAFIVSDALLSRMGRFMRYGTVGRQAALALAERAFERTLQTDEELSTLLSELLEMNYAAVNARYDEAAKAEKFQYRETPLRNSWLTSIQAFKDAECLKYQCSEGDVPKTPLFACLEKYGHEIACRIIHDLPEYEAATWD